MNEVIIEQEVRIRLLESIAKNIEKKFDQIERTMKQDKFELITKIDSHFHWTLGIIITFFGGIILHMAKLI